MANEKGMVILKMVRKQKGLKAVEVCRGCGIHPVIISAVENRRLVAGKKVRKIMCDFYGISEAKAFDKTGLAAI